MSAARPPKRAHGSVTHSCQTPLLKVKRERSPSPVSVERRPVTSGTKRYAPVPDNCFLSCPEYKRNRLDWIAGCVKELEGLNLIPERKLIRDDGLIVDWRSHVPVWSDTLKPAPPDLVATILLAHRSNARWHNHSAVSESFSNSLATQELPTSSDSPPSSRERFPFPPHSSLKRRNNFFQPILESQPSQRNEPFFCAERLRLRDETGPSRDHVSELASHTSIASDIPTQYDQLPKSPNRARNPSIASRTPSAAEEQMSEMTLDYLRRYVQTYEADRASLASAYGRNASFAFRVHRITRNTNESASSLWTDSLQCFASGARRTRLDIVITLLTLPRLHSNAQGSGTARVEYDMFCLGGELGMFVVCRVVLFTKTVVHNFVLQRKEVDAEDGAVQGVWPLTATAHQILVFQT